MCSSRYYSKRSSSSSKETRDDARRSYSKGRNRRNSQVDSSPGLNGSHGSERTPQTRSPHSDVPTYGAYVYRSTARPPQNPQSHPRSRSRSQPRSKLLPYEETWTCRASQWRSEIVVLDRTRGVFGGVDKRIEFPISIAPDARVEEIVSFLTKGRRGVRVMVLWHDGAKEPLDRRFHSAEALTRSAERLELKYEERVHWRP